MVTSFTAVHDVARFGAEVLRASPRQADLMVVAGTCFTKMAPVIQRLYDQMLEPKMGHFYGRLRQLRRHVRYLFGSAGRLISSSRWMWYIPGCPPRPEAYMQALMLLQESIGKERRPPLMGGGRIRACIAPICSQNANVNAASVLPSRTCVPRTRFNLRLSAAALHFANHYFNSAKHCRPPRTILQW
ncbi:NADH dehydrogenase I chain B [Salmonella enterica subsp. enterica]|uniref:NADH dehydrogenase I chain B n=1 Tax=Salmonella enterica I TaxID=59201 RepID=A0A3S4LTZ3_SALET|nr:NADH dehydrogenase I chain B [Salmonella enterica subsp. enterica]